jgi:hypothetical protein
MEKWLPERMFDAKIESENTVAADALSSSGGRRNHAATQQPTTTTNNGTIRRMQRSQNPTTEKKRYLLLIRLRQFERLTKIRQSGPHAVVEQKPAYSTLIKQRAL